MTVKSGITATIFYQAKCIFGELFQRFLRFSTEGEGEILGLGDNNQLDHGLRRSNLLNLYLLKNATSSGLWVYNHADRDRNRKLFDRIGPSRSCRFRACCCKWD